jgi:hypothetical protein
MYLIHCTLPGLGHASFEPLSFSVLLMLTRMGFIFGCVFFVVFGLKDLLKARPRIGSISFCTLKRKSYGPSDLRLQNIIAKLKPRLSFQGPSGRLTQCCRASILQNNVAKPQSYQIASLPLLKTARYALSRCAAHAARGSSAPQPTSL